MSEAVRDLAKTLAQTSAGHGGFINNFTDDTLDAFELWATAIANPATLGANYPTALAFLVLHQATRASMSYGAASGAISGRSDSESPTQEGTTSTSTSVSYSTPTFTHQTALDAYLSTTAWGWQYKTLADMTIASLPCTVF